MNLKYMMLNEKTHILKTYILYDSVYMIIWKDKNIGTENRSVVSRGQGRGESLTLKGQHEGILWGTGIVLNSVCDGFKNPGTCKNS